MKAVWKGTIIAESDDTVVGNHYFPVEAVTAAHIRPSATKSTCGWKRNVNIVSRLVTSTAPTMPAEGAS